ncbi:MAG: hypothetical protein J6Q84_08320 [Kiritimatiellae bacterium]|nr:hypothetical protein [Kiritimatiellia bacterium]
MKKSIILSVIAVLAMNVLAQGAVDAKKKPLTPEEKSARKAMMMERMLKHTGGRIIRPGTKAGKVVYVNCQTRASKEWIAESVAYFSDVSKFTIEIEDGKFDFKKPEIHGNASLFIIDDPEMPSFLVAPEARWAMVNVYQLAKDAKPAFFQARVKKQLTRGFAALCGAMNSGYPNALTGGVTDVKELDRFVDARLPVDVISRFASYMQPFGVTPAVITTYRKACQEGWAPAPTNDYQKAIAEAVAKEKTETLKGPANPRKIKFDPKKGE